MKFNRYARFVPGIDDTKLTPEEKIIGGDHIEHWRGVLRHLQVDDQAQKLVQLDGRIAEHVAHVEHAQAAHFQAILEQRRAGAVDQVRRNLGERGRVVLEHEPCDGVLGPGVCRDQ